jgi:hypothetical protein
VLYLIGGAARSGKSVLARRLLLARQAPCFCADYLTSGLETGAPSLGVRHEGPGRERGELAWPVLRGVLRNVVEVEPEYVVEGDVLLPGKVAEQAAEYDGRVRACFLGYARCTVDAKVASIRSFPSPVNDWVAGMSDQGLAELVVEMQEFSRSLEVECRRLGLGYFDTGMEFGNALRRAEAYLVGGGPPVDHGEIVAVKGMEDVR